MTSRRSFLAALGLAPGVARSYFDLGPSWQRHASGLVVPEYRVWCFGFIANDDERLPTQTTDSLGILYLG